MAYAFNQVASSESNNGSRTDARGMTFDPDHPNYHYHEFEGEICSLSSVCSPEQVALASLMHPAPGYLSNTTPIVDGQYGVAQLGYSAPWDNLGPIVHTVSSDGFTIRNYTVEGHDLHPGYVERSVFVRNGTVHIRTIGEGIGANPGFNNALSRPLWNGIVDSHIRYRINLGYRQQ